MEAHPSWALPEITVITVPLSLKSKEFSENNRTINRPRYGYNRTTLLDADAEEGGGWQWFGETVLENLVFVLVGRASDGIEA